MTRTLVIANGLLPDRVRQRLLPALSQVLGACPEWQFTSAPGDALAKARQALRSGVQWLIVAGGDGTINEVVNGYFEQGGNFRPDCPLSFLPLGSGNDWARTLGVPLDPRRAIASLARARDRLVDVALAQYRNQRGDREERVFVNFAEAGVGALLVASLNRGSARRNRAAYLLSAVATAFRYKARTVALRFADAAESRQPLLSLIVANGRFFGAGMQCAPMARPDDGMLDVITIGDFGRLELLMKIRKLVRGRHLSESKVAHHAISHLEASAESRVCLELDGDRVGTLPATFSVLPHSLLVRC